MPLHAEHLEIQEACVEAREKKKNCPLYIVLYSPFIYIYESCWAFSCWLAIIVQCVGNIFLFIFLFVCLQYKPFFSFYCSRFVCYSVRFFFFFLRNLSYRKKDHAYAVSECWYMWVCDVCAYG